MTLFSGALPPRNDRSHCANAANANPARIPTQPIMTVADSNRARPRITIENCPTSTRSDKSKEDPRANQRWGEVLKKPLARPRSMNMRRFIDCQFTVVRADTFGTDHAHTRVCNTTSSECINAGLYGAGVNVKDSTKTTLESQEKTIRCGSRIFRATRRASGKSMSNPITNAGRNRGKAKR